jgi:nucleoside-diphosphate-sugar epimerase
MNPDEGDTMKVLVAGATGALGKQLVPLLVARGHEVVGMTRTAAKREQLEALGATPAVADALDPDAVARVVAEARPDAIIHELTALNVEFDPRHLERTFAMTNRLRTEGTDHLIAAGRAVGVKRFVAQSFAGWGYVRAGEAVTAQTEDEPLDLSVPVPALRGLLGAIRHLEEATLAEGGIVLRYGGFYGPGTSIDGGDGDMNELLRKRRLPIVGSGDGVWSFIHVADAAEATVIALERGEPGIYNVVDDEPAAVREWIPVAAKTFGAPAPRRVPGFLGRLLGGKVTTIMMTQARGASNAKARRRLGWEPRHSSWRQGFAELAA